MRFYSTFPRDLREIFNVKTAHMGHHAKSLGLREQPSSLGRTGSKPKQERPRNRLTNEEKREPFSPKFRPKTLEMASKVTRGTRVAAGGGRFNKNERPFQEKRGLDFARGLKTAKMLTVSEFDSGLPPLKRKKK